MAINEYDLASSCRAAAAGWRRIAAEALSDEERLTALTFAKLYEGSAYDFEHSAPPTLSRTRVPAGSPINQREPSGDKPPSGPISPSGDHWAKKPCSFGEGCWSATHAVTRALMAR